MFKGLSAFPLTPVNERDIQEPAFNRLVETLASAGTGAGVDTLGVLGSTGSYAYLTRRERARVVELAVAHAGRIPVMAGIGALRTRDVLALAEDAQRAGASAVMLAPVSYQPLTEDDVFTLYETLDRALDVPLCVYDNPGTTRFHFSDALYQRIACLPSVGAIKIPPINPDPTASRERVAQLKRLLPETVSLGISGDPVAATALNSGCDGWHSVVGGLYPEPALAITRAAQAGQHEAAETLSRRLEPLWALYRQHGGSLRVIATAAELSGAVAAPSLPLPLHTLQGDARRAVAGVMETLGF